MECFYIWPDQSTWLKTVYGVKKNVLFEAPDSFADARLGDMGKKENCVCLHTKYHSGSATKLKYHDTIIVFRVVC